MLRALDVSSLRIEPAVGNLEYSESSKVSRTPRLYSEVKISEPSLLTAHTSNQWSQNIGASLLFRKMTISVVLSGTRPVALETTTHFIGPPMRRRTKTSLTHKTWPQNSNVDPPLCHRPLSVVRGSVRDDQIQP